MGLYRAGFDVTGVDIKPQPHYPFPFILADAMIVSLEGYDAYWASPPCQAYSIMRNLPWLRDKPYPKLIVPTRERLVGTGKFYVIENVSGARYRLSLPEGLKAGWLCGTMFGLPFYRHRYFETNWFWMQPGHPRHQGIVRPSGSLGGRAREIVFSRSNGAQRLGCGIGHAAGVNLVRQAMGVDWMTRDELSQAIPPVYSEFLGKYLLKAIAEMEA